jgi:hypothetical protein
MRRTFKPTWIINKKDELVGINLGADYCAEHEFGISYLKTILGINDREPEGITSRQITVCDSSNLFYFSDKASKKKTGKSYLLIDKSYMIQDYSNMKNIPQDLITKSLTDLTSAWDKSSFGLIARTKEDRLKLETLYNAIINKKVAIWLGGSGPFKNAGLIIAIIDKVDQEDLDTMLSSDLDCSNLKKIDTSLNIKETLMKANKSCLLTPRWKTPETKTSYPIYYWVMPGNTKDYNYGLFTIEELEEWIEDRGPICKN